MNVEIELGIAQRTSVMGLEKYKIAIVGSGPGGLSAAAHAAEMGISHVLLEGAPQISKTIRDYQKGKHVMAEPGILPLRSPVVFEAGKREQILECWESSIREHEVNVRYNAEINHISGGRGEFSLQTTSGETISAENVILGIGMQGNPRRLNVPGDDADWVQYQLADPEEYENETIAVVGAGDAAIEDAIALSKNNEVHIVNRRDEFARAKEGNLNLIESAINEGKVGCFYNATPKRIEKPENDEFAGVLILDTPTGEISVPVHRVIARLGAIAPRGLVESFGIEFPSDDPSAIPALSSQYESNVQGIYVIGALGGYPLIKHAMNQGYEVVEYILGNKVQPADHEILAEKFAHLPGGLDVDDALSFAQRRIPVFSNVNSLQFRELMLDSHVHHVAEGDVIFEKDDYTNSFYTVLEGNVEIEVNDSQRISSGVGNFFGEMSLLSGRRRSATVYGGKNCVVIETPRRSMVKLIASVADVKNVIDQTFIVRTIQQKLTPELPQEELMPVARRTTINQFGPGETIFEEGDEGDSLHFIRSGSVTVSTQVEGRDVIMSYVPANESVGEMALLGNTKRTATVKAAVKTETLSIDSESFSELLDNSPGLKARMHKQAQDRMSQNIALKSSSVGGDNMLSFLIGQGLGEATDVLLIDKDLCVGCDNCEKACAATHNGTSRLDRKAGSSFANIHVPASCRHCEDPSCMKDCPPNAIQRGGIGGEVFINDSCIGCGNCEKNCPYGVIQMAYEEESSDGFWGWMLFGLGRTAGKETKRDENAIKKAAKCDMCKDVDGGPSCVRACPTGAAARLSPENFVELLS